MAKAPKTPLPTVPIHMQKRLAMGHMAETGAGAGPMGGKNPPKTPA
jgi:uncharacterized membrane protein